MKKKFIISFLLSLLAFGTVFYLGYKKKMAMMDNNKKSPDTLTQENDDENRTGEETPEELDPQFPESDKVLKEKRGNEILFLLMGIDKKDAGQKEMRGQRSDAMMLTKINFDDGSIKMLSLPRDTIVKIKGQDDKLTHAHSYGGPALALKTVRNWLNLDVKYYVRIDYTAVQELVGAVGGVEFDVPINMHYVDTTKGNELYIDFKKGKQLITKDNVVGLLRFRKGYADQDKDRQKTQQAFLKALAKKVLDLKNVTKIGAIWSAISKNVKTNIPNETIMSCLLQCTKLDPEKMQTDQFTNYTAHWIKYGHSKIQGIDLKKSDIKEKMEKWFSNYKLR